MAAARKRSLWRRALLAGAGALRRPQGVDATAVHGRAGGRLMAAATKGSLSRRALLAGAGALAVTSASAVVSSLRRREAR